MTSRTTAAVATTVTGLAAVYIVALLLGLPDPGWAHLARGVVHLGELAAVVAVALCGAAGSGLLGRAGLGAAGLGLLLMAVAEVITFSSPGLSETLFSVAPTLVGLGLLVAGGAVVRTGRFTGWRRWAVLALGVYIFAVLTPVIIAAGGPPAPAAVAALAGWQILWTLIGIAVLAETARARVVST